MRKCDEYDGSGSVTDAATSWPRWVATSRPESRAPAIFFFFFFFSPPPPPFFFFFFFFSCRCRASLTYCSSMRGVIYDRKGRELAISIPMNSVFADPVDVKGREMVAPSLHLH